MATSLLETFRKLDVTIKHALADISSPRLLAFATLEISETKCGIDRLSSEHIVACLEAAGVAVKKISISRALASATGHVSLKKDGYEKISVVRIEKNQPRTARLEISEVFQKLEGVVRICDPYYGIRTLDLLDHIPKRIKVKFLTSKTNEAGRKLRGALKDFKIERPNVEFMTVGQSAGLHDRFVITNKDLVPDLIKETINAFDLKWNTGTKI